VTCGAVAGSRQRWHYQCRSGAIVWERKEKGEGKCNRNLEIARGFVESEGRLARKSAGKSTCVGEKGGFAGLISVGVHGSVEYAEVFHGF